MEIVSDISETEWREALNRFEGATIYHTPAWKRFLESVFGFMPCYLFALDETGGLRGLLPLFQIKSWITGERLCSVPFSHTCGPVGDEDCIAALIGRAIEIYRDSRGSHLEIRSRIERAGFQNVNHFSTYVLDLSSDIDQVWRKLDKGSVRRAIKKSQKSGLIVDVTKDPEDIDAFYELNTITKRNKGVPCHTLIL